MLRLQQNAPLMTVLNQQILAAFYSKPKKIANASFNTRIRLYNRPGNLQRYTRKFLIRPPDLSNKSSLTFPITIPMRVRHQPKRQKNPIEFIENSQKIRWNRLTPNQMLLAFEHIQYLDFHELVQGLRYLSQVSDQEKHNWNKHAWISKALDSVNDNFIRIKKNKILDMYYLMKKLKYQNQIFWQKIYAKIEEMMYDLPHSQFENFFMRYYKAGNKYFSTQMPQKFLTLMENRLRSFRAENIVKIYEIFEEQNRLDHYWKYNVFIPLFKSQQYVYQPRDLHRIFRFMLILNHQKDDRLYASLYNRLTNYETMTLEEVELLIEVVSQIKDLFISHRVDPYLEHLEEKKKEIEKKLGKVKKEIPLHQLVRQDLVFFMHKQKLAGNEKNRKNQGKKQKQKKEGKKKEGEKKEGKKEEGEKSEEKEREEKKESQQSETGESVKQAVDKKQ